MNSSENEAFKAGEPAPTSAPIERDAVIKADEATSLDRFVLAVKPFERWGILAGVGIQLLVLFALIVKGGFKVVTGGF